MNILWGIQTIGARVALAFLALAFIVPMFQSIFELGDQISPGCDVPGGERIARAFVPGVSTAYTMHPSPSGGCTVEGSPAGPLSLTPTDDVADATLTVSNGTITGGTWNTAEDTGTLLRLLETPLAMGAVALVAILGLAAIILF